MGWGRIVIERKFHISLRKNLLWKIYYSYFVFTFIFLFNKHHFTESSSSNALKKKIIYIYVFAVVKKWPTDIGTEGINPSFSYLETVFADFIGDCFFWAILHGDSLYVFSLFLFTLTNLKSLMSTFDDEANFPSLFLTSIVVAFCESMVSWYISPVG